MNIQIDVIDIPLSAFLNLIEITTAISKTRNVYFISFMLGFAGLCVWMQVLSQIKANIFKFTVLRTAQGTLSALITMFIIRRLNIAVPAVSNTAGAHIEAINSGYTLAFSMLVMVILLLVSISSKNHTGNLLKDMV